MMTEVHKTVQGVDPHEYEALKTKLVTEEEFNVTDTGVDSFVAKQGNLITLLGDYNRNGNILTIVGKFSSWLGLDSGHFADEILRVVQKEDATGQVQHRPLMTPATSEATATPEDTEAVEAEEESNPPIKHEDAAIPEVKKTPASQ